MATISDAAPRAPAWQRRKAFREGEILAAAIDVIEEFGPEQISIPEIANRANVSEATVYKYFESKNRLIDQAITATLEPTVEFLEKEIPRIENCEQKLRFLIVRSMLDMVARPMSSRAIYGQMRWERRIDSLKLLHRRLADIVSDIFRVGIERGEIDPDTDVVLAGDMLFGGIASVGWRTLLAGREVPGGIEGFATRFAHQIMAGVSATRPDAAPLLDRLEDLVARFEQKGHT